MTSSAAPTAVGAPARLCPICRTPLRDDPVERWDRYALYECPGCALRVWHPPAAGSAEWYDTSDHYLAKPLVDWLGWYHTEAVRSLGPEVRTLLDIGCADGRFVYAVAALRGIDARGIDHSERLVRMGNQRHGGDRLSKTAIEEFQASGRTFDAVTLFEVIEHVAEPLALLELAATVTRPGGQLLVSTPNRLGFPRGTHPMDRPPHHITRWTPETLATALRSAGFTDVHVSTSPGWVGLKGWLLDRFRLGLVIRLLRRGSAAGGTGAPAGASTIRGAILFKDRLAGALAWILSPLVGSRFAHGSMIASARRRSDEP